MLVYKFYLNLIYIKKIFKKFNYLKLKENLNLSFHFELILFIYKIIKIIYFTLYIININLNFKKNDPFKLKFNFILINYFKNKLLIPIYKFYFNLWILNNIKLNNIMKYNIHIYKINNVKYNINYFISKINFNSLNIIRKNYFFIKLRLNNLLIKNISLFFNETKKVNFNFFLIKYLVFFKKKSNIILKLNFINTYILYINYLLVISNAFIETEKILFNNINLFFNYLILNIFFSFKKKRLFINNK